MKRLDLKSPLKMKKKEVIKMAEKKRCPLLFNQKNQYLEGCGEDKCAWWIDGLYNHETGCSLAVLARTLTIINREGLSYLAVKGD